MTNLPQTLTIIFLLISFVNICIALFFAIRMAIDASKRR